MILVLVDAHSKWIDAHIVSSATSSVTIEHLMQTFATYGLPKSLVSDNCSCFTSEEFCTFMKTNGVHHITSSHYHTASNGLAERAVEEVKHGLRKIEGGSLQNKLCRVLARYRITPHSTIGTSPADLLLKHHLRHIATRYF